MRICGKQLCGFIQLAKCFPCIFAAYQPLGSQYSPIILFLDFTRHFEVPLPTSHPFVNTHNTTSPCVTAQIYLIWWETLKAATGSKGGLKR